MIRDFHLSMYTYYDTAESTENDTTRQAEDPTTWRLAKMVQIVNGDLADPWTKRELHLHLDQIIAEMEWAVKRIDENPR